MTTKPISLSDEYIESEIKKARDRVDELLIIKRLWEEEYSSDDFITFVFYTYLHTCNVAETTEIVNEKGFRKKGYKDRDIKYSSTDISDIIRSEKPSNPELDRVCKNLLNHNTWSNKYLN